MYLWLLRIDSWSTDCSLFLNPTCDLHGKNVPLSKIFGNHPFRPFPQIGILAYLPVPIRRHSWAVVYRDEVSEQARVRSSCPAIQKPMLPAKHTEMFGSLTDERQNLCLRMT